eukprot:3477156-Prymnesium_polylepis.1
MAAAPWPAGRSWRGRGGQAAAAVDGWAGSVVPARASRWQAAGRSPPVAARRTRLERAVRDGRRQGRCRNGVRKSGGRKSFKRETFRRENGRGARAAEALVLRRAEGC